MAFRMIGDWIPGLRVARSYQRDCLGSDLRAGLSVAAVAVPTGIAYAQLAGLPPVVGLYASILPPAAYALFGSSRQLIVGPDSATCAMVAAAILPLAAGDPTRYAALSVLLTLLVGVLGIAGGLLRLGFIANFLSIPILTGFLNGIALSIISGQLGKLFGFQVSPQGFFRLLGEFVSKLGQTHWPTAVLGLSLFVLLRLLKRLAPSVPAPLVAVVVGIAAVYLFQLDAGGVSVIGTVPAGFPLPSMPFVKASDVGALVYEALGIVVISFCSAMLTARSFAAKHHYEIDANRDLIALGLSNLASGISQGFVISGADSRTAISDSVGGKTPLTALVAAAAMLAVLVFATAPLAYLPHTALAAVLISAALGLFDVPTLKELYRVSPAEFRHALVAMLGIITVGVLPGVLIAIGLAILRLLALASQPSDAILGQIEGDDGFYNIEGQPRAQTIPGLVLYRFDGALLFFNADYFKKRVRAAIAQAATRVEGFLFVAEGVNLIDTTGAAALEEMRTELAGRGIVFAVAQPKGQFRAMLERTGLSARIGVERLYPSVRAAVEALSTRKQ